MPTPRPTAFPVVAPAEVAATPMSIAAATNAVNTRLYRIALPSLVVPSVEGAFDADLDDRRPANECIANAPRTFRDETARGGRPAEKAGEWSSRQETCRDTDRYRSANAEGAPGRRRAEPALGRRRSDISRACTSPRHGAHSCRS